VRAFSVSGGISSASWPGLLFGPAIHVFVYRSKDLDARDKRGHDDGST
jgi:hypothetical protein